MCQTFATLSGPVSSLLHHFGAQAKWLVLRQDNRSFHSFHSCSTASAICDCQLVLPPVFWTKRRAWCARCGRGARAPRSKPFVVAFYFFVRQPYAPQRIARRLRRHTEAGLIGLRFLGQRFLIRAPPRFRRLLPSTGSSAVTIRLPHKYFWAPLALHVHIRFPVREPQAAVLPFNLLCRLMATALAVHPNVRVALPLLLLWPPPKS